VGMVSDLHQYRRARREQLREYLARTLAFGDTYLFGTEPHFLGPPIPIDGPPQR
jgi:vancomycin permeability regulator SanA